MPPLTLDAVDAQLIARLAVDFPLSAAPFAEIADELGLDQQQVLARLRRLHAAGAISAPLPQRRRAPRARRSALVGAQVEPEQVDAIAARVCALPAVVHAEQRRHRYNLWLTLAAGSTLALERACAQVQARIGAPLLVLPHETTYLGALLWMA